MVSSQHKSSHQARAIRRGLDVVTSADISPSRRTQPSNMHFLVQISIENEKKSNFAVKRIAESAR